MLYRGVCESIEERVVRGNRLSLGGGTSHQFGATSASTSFLLQEISAFSFWTKNSWCPKRQQECLHNYPFFNLLQYFTGPTPVHN